VRCGAVEAELLVRAGEPEHRRDDACGVLDGDRPAMSGKGDICLHQGAHPGGVQQADPGQVEHDQPGLGHHEHLQSRLVEQV